MAAFTPGKVRIPQELQGWVRPCQFGALAALAAALGTFFMPNIYRSEARLLPMETKMPGGGALSAAAAAFGLSVPTGEGGEGTFPEVLRSRWMADGLLDTPYTFKARSWRLGPERLRRETLAGFLDKKNRDRAVTWLEDSLTVNRDTKSRVVTLSMESSSPQLAQAVVHRAIELLEAFSQEKGRTRGGAKAVFAEARLDEARGEMRQAETAFRRFLENNRNFQLSPDPQTRLEGSRLEAELKLRQQLVVTLALNREQALMEEKNDLPIVNVLDAGALPNEKCRPHRSLYVLAAFFLATLGGWAWPRRAWLLARTLAPDEPGPVQPR